MKPMSDRLSVVQGDITGLTVDAIVNAANAALVPGGGVDRAINEAAGPELGAAMRAIGGCARERPRSRRDFA
jgi:O-acetyl-ADP-ribose deacetylase (regulator of RNase III)